MNDILSLKEAGVGVSINAKSQLNLNASDIIVLNENLWKIVSLFKLKQYSSFFIVFNLIWVFLYNLSMIPMAAGVGNSEFQMSPFISSLSMSLSSILVVIFSNILRLINFDFTK